MIRKSKLINENERLKRKLFIWENIGVSINSSVRDKELAAKAFLESHPDFNLYQISETIKINKGTLYNHILRKIEKTSYEERKEILTKEIIKIFNNSRKLYGAGKIVLALKKQGTITSERYVVSIMKENNLVVNSIIKKKEPYVNKEKQFYYRNLLKRRFNQDAPNKVWTSDFLEINVRGVKFHLCVILDLFARKVVGWRVGTQANENLLINAFKDAFSERNEPMDLIFHSDQGIQFKSHKFIELLKMLDVRQSFSNRGSPYDNACMEGFYSKLRSEEINVNIEHYQNLQIIREYLSSYFNFYNNERIHTSNNGLTPTEKEEQFYKNKN